MPQNPQAIIARKKQRLEKLEERQAIMGISTPLEVVTEFEDLRREIGDYGHAELLDGERRVTVRQRLQAAARRRGLALHFRPGRGPLIFRVDVAPARPPEIIPSSAAEPPDRGNGHAAEQRGPEQRRPRRDRRPAAGRYDAMLPRWMREGQPQDRRAGSKRRVK